MEHNRASDHTAHNLKGPCNMATENLTPIEKQAHAFLFEIASIASNNDDLCTHLHGAITGDSHAMDCEMERLRGVICQLGYIAELGIQRLGSGGVRGASPEHWILPPSCQMPETESQLA